ncbi:MAG TPA: hypothetical protein DIW28_05815, partial [Zetaproteobacteria bacterium]|nr:hypothetical protein [Zetaproteobacteria bacterium]
VAEGARKAEEASKPSTAPEVTAVKAVQSKVRTLRSSSSGTSSMVTGRQSISFAQGGSELSSAAEGELKAVVALMKKNPSLRIELVGFSDNEGSRVDNHETSVNRAQAVADFLTAHGIQASRLMTKGYGDASPVADNSTSEGRAANRRVEFYLSR